MSHRAAGSEAGLKITHPPACLGNRKKSHQFPPGIANYSNGLGQKREGKKRKPQKLEERKAVCRAK